jgi:hypothetical protein
MAAEQVMQDPRAAQIQETVTQSQIFASIDLLLQLKRWSEGSVEEAVLIYDYLYLTGFELGIGHAFGSEPYLTPDSNNVFSSKSVCKLVCFGITLRIEYHLGDAYTVTEINEDKTTVISTPLDPTHEDNAVAGVVGTKGATVVSAFPVTERIQSHLLPSESSAY